MLDLSEVGVAMGDSRLYTRVDDNGVLWAICEICTEWTEEQHLALDPTDGKRWSICATCYNNGGE